MAGIELLRNTLFALEIGEGFAEQNFLFDLKTILFQVDHPAVAAVSRRGFIDCD
jgi:hypothetical protein